jgi:hypothetical protein
MMLVLGQACSDPSSGKTASQKGNVTVENKVDTDIVEATSGPS